MELLELRYKSLLGVCLTIDQLLQKIKQKAYQDANEWLKKFRPDDVASSKITSIDIGVCNAAVIAKFKLCYKKNLQFLSLYLQHKHGIESITPRVVFRNCYRIGVISHAELQHLLTMVDSLYDLCHLCDEKGDHIVSVDLIEYYQIMNSIILRLNPK